MLSGSVIRARIVPIERFLPSTYEGVSSVQTNFNVILAYKFRHYLALNRIGCWSKFSLGIEALFVLAAIATFQFELTLLLALLT